MSKKIIAVNAGPRMGWNTDTLITEASRGAESAGAVVERYDLSALTSTLAVFHASAARGRRTRGAACAGTALRPFWMRYESPTVL